MTHPLSHSSRNGIVIHGDVRRGRQCCRERSSLATRKQIVRSHVDRATEIESLRLEAPEDGLIARARHGRVRVVVKRAGREAAAALEHAERRVVDCRVRVVVRR